MAGKHDKRLVKVEYSLTPKQAVVLWLEETLQHGSVQAYAHWLKDQPASAYPLFRRPGQVRQAVKDAMRGRPREVIERAVERAERDVTFLFKLFMAVNARVLVEQRTDALGYLWLLERLRRLWDAPPTVLRKEAAAWREHALLLVSEAYALAGMVEGLAQRYFGGHTLLFPAEAEGVAQATQAWDTLLAMYTDHLYLLPPKQRQALALTPEFARAGGCLLVSHDVEFLVAQAKAETLQLLGDYEGPRCWSRRTSSP